MAAQETPLQEKLGILAEQIGKAGLVCAVATFFIYFISIWGRHGGEDPLTGILDGFIIAVVVVVVAIPEGLPLAVTISLAFSTGKMYDDMCFVRILSACETMGNATTICSDKTGTLTENRMKVVEGWFGNVLIDQAQLSDKTGKARSSLAVPVRAVIIENCCLNRVAYLAKSQLNDKEGALNREVSFMGEVAPRLSVRLTDIGLGTDQRNPLNDDKMDTGPVIVGNKTEGALILLAKDWGYDYSRIEKQKFDDNRDKKYAFNSTKKRSTCIIFKSDGSCRLLCKGAPEYIISDCTHFNDNAQQSLLPMTPEKRADLETVLGNMTSRALRTLCLAHKDFASINDLPADWRDNPPDVSGLCCDCIVGIMDPLRHDVKDAVNIAQRAGVVVRMVTGDSLATAKAIAKQCGILTSGGLALEGPTFRNMTPAQLDSCIHRLQVVARSSPKDKYVLVSRLNGKALPEGMEEWTKYYEVDRPGATWEKDRDNVLPGHREEWMQSRPDGGEVVGVTGDGTNDAPALKAADVGLAMGSGTKVAHSAADIVILDDQFSSIVRAIMWGRAVYDNIRKFIQFQITINCVALTMVLAGAIADSPEPPLTAVMMLWINLVQDTMAALAFGTEPPSVELLRRKPYKLSASLISRPMARNILVQSVVQLIILLTLMFGGEKMFNVNPNGFCLSYDVKSTSSYWDAATGQKTTVPTNLMCESWNDYCAGGDQNCLDQTNIYNATIPFQFSQLDGFESECLDCNDEDKTLAALIFNSFVFAQVFNEFNARILFDKPLFNIFAGLEKNRIFILIIFITVFFQSILINFGGAFLGTSPLSAQLWMASIGLGFLSIPAGILQRSIVIKEDPDDFATADKQDWYTKGDGPEEDDNEPAFAREPSMIMRLIK